MPQLYITQAKPNPLGKDRFGFAILSQQLSGEWLDFRNTHTSSLSLNKVVIQHVAYTLMSPNGVWETAYDFRGDGVTLGAGETLRIHSGGFVYTNTLAPQDSSGADHRFFTGKGYIWNNQKPDTARIVVVQNDGKIVVIDQAGYSSHSAEGAILHRIGDHLI